MQSTITRLTTGKRINTAQDDAAGLAEGDQFQAQANQATQDVQTQNNSYFAAQAGDGYLSEATAQLQTAVSLVEGGNAGSAEMTSVLGNATNAVTKASASGSANASLAAITTAITALTTAAGAATYAQATTALGAVDTARGVFGATMASAQSSANLAGISAENATSEESNVMDANIGNEVVNLTKWQVLSQAGTSALSSANQSSQYVLALFR
jgi:flagellin